MGVQFPPPLPKKYRELQIFVDHPSPVNIQPLKLHVPQIAGLLPTVKVGVKDRDRQVPRLRLGKPANDWLVENERAWLVQGKSLSHCQTCCDFGVSALFVHAELELLV